MKKIIKNISKLTISGLALIGALYTAPAQAQTVAAATTYKIQVNKIELCKSAACTSPITIGSGSTSFDIASAGVGASIGSYASLDGIPKGTTVTHIRATLSRAINVLGTAADPNNIGNPCSTRLEGGAPSSSATNFGLGTTGAAAEQVLTVPNELVFSGQPTAGTYAANDITLINATEMTILKALPTPFTMGDVPPVVDIAFGTATALQAFDSNGAFAGGLCFMVPAPPAITITVN